MTDLGSQNGIYVDENKVVQHKLKDGERIIIGKTAFRYNIIINKETSLIEDEEDEEEDENLGKKERKNSDQKKKNKNKKIIYFIAGLFCVFLF